MKEFATYWEVLTCDVCSSHEKHD